MDQMNNMETLLWEYIDGFSSAEERSAVEQHIREHAEWRQKYEELLALHQSINLVEMEQPSMRFTRNVMEEIARLQITPAAKQYINSKVIYGIGAFFVTVIIAFLVYALSQIDWSSGQQVNSSVLDKISQADYSKVFNNTFVNAFLMINVILGLLLFDRYLNQRRREMGIDMLS